MMDTAAYQDRLRKVEEALDRRGLRLIPHEVIHPSDPGLLAPDGEFVHRSLARSPVPLYTVTRGRSDIPVIGLTAPGQGMPMLATRLTLIQLEQCVRTAD